MIFTLPVLKLYYMNLNGQTEEILKYEKIMLLIIGNFIAKKKLVKKGMRINDLQAILEVIFKSISV